MVEQVGGSHYQNEANYLHWDFVLDTSIGYFESQVTKYICRWHKKNGLQDLQKSMSYLDKLIENIHRVAKPYGSICSSDVVDPTEKLKAAYGLTVLEADICQRLASWYDSEDLRFVRNLIIELIAEAEPQPVPLEDSNKHSERANDLRS